MCINIHERFSTRCRMSKYGVRREGASVAACVFVVADGCHCGAVHSFLMVKNSLQWAFMVYRSEK